MTVFIPEADRLLAAATDYLEHELLPTLTGYHGFQTRVCVNVLRIVMRELQQREPLEQAEHARLRQLLGHEGKLDALNAQLADGISSGELPLDTPGLAEHLRLTLADALRINNPKWVQAQ